MFSEDDASERALRDVIGKSIAALSIEDDALFITFSDGKRLRLYDDGQTCCEARYMSTDDDLKEFVGAKLLGAEIKEAPDINDGDEAHEVAFLEVQTDRGVFTMANHNQHNGYYGGFLIRAVVG